MSPATRHRAVGATSWALVITAGLLVPVVEAGTTYLTLLGAAGAAAAVVAATQVRQDDVLGWLAAVCTAAPIAALVAAAHTDGLPGHRAGGWTASSAAAVALCTAVVLAGLLRPLVRSRPAGTLVP